MKNFISLSTLCFLCFTSFAQLKIGTPAPNSIEHYFQEFDSTTYVEVKAYFDDQGRFKREERKYISKEDFPSILFNQIYQRDLELNDMQNELNDKSLQMQSLINYFKEIKGTSYSEYLNDIKKKNFVGNWKLKVNDKEYQVESNSQNTIIYNVKNESQKMGIKYIRSNVISIFMIDEDKIFDHAILQEKKQNGEVWFEGQTLDQNNYIKLCR